MSQWKPIPNYENYEASSEGEIRRNGKILKPYSLNKGHLIVSLCKNGKSKKYLIHRLVLETFIGPCPEGMETCHFPDKDPTNNKLNNIRWDTRSANRQDSKKHGTWLNGSKHPNAKLTENDVKKIKKSDKTHQKLAIEFGIARSIITRIKNGQRWRHV